MSVSIAELPNLIDPVNDSVNTFQEVSLRSSLETFAQQFELKGCSVWQFYLDWQKSCQVECSSESNELPDAAASITPSSLENEIDWQALNHAPLFEVILIKDHYLSNSGQLYGCLYHRGPKSYHYLLCWHDKPLSEHQRYGISLYVHTLNQQRSPACSTNEPTNEQMLPQVLQRIRHQLRTPLSLILLYIDLLASTTADSRSQEWLQNLHYTTEEMHASLNHLTETATAPEPQFGSYDLQQLVQQCDQVMQPWLKEKHIQLIYDHQPLKLHINGWKIKQALQNLLSNAIAFSPPERQITCEWQVFQTEVLIKIRDEGPGLSAEDLRSWGTPFYSRRPGGTGLGLAIAKEIIAEHKGSLWAENLPQCGAQFCIVLPRMP
jgi:two-component sensor histidine kinase